ncbi:MAG: hypothetical protein M1833_006916 [Piccolia ochrophora]|nr:MAG: hypothetical protein M1833_006916 [Piccolia ochrophora]
MTATTALTAQNTKGVYGIHHTPPDFVKQQIDACVEDIGVDAVKIGMLSSAETINVVMDAFSNHHFTVSVLDPVMVSTSGARLLSEDAIRSLRETLLPQTTILTPNVAEAQLLLKDAGKSVQDPKGLEDLIDLATAVQGLGPEYVLLKGGHAPLTETRSIASQGEEYMVADVLVGNGSKTIIETAFQASKNTHGTGCCLASALACNLAKKVDIPRAVKAACRYVEAGIRFSEDIGQGNGPIQHFHSTFSLPFAPGGFVEYILEREDVQKPWKQYTEHGFTRLIADGTLPIASFKKFMIQDYLFLSAGLVASVRQEMNTHIDFCKQFGLSQEEMASHEESQACTAYTRYVLDIGQSEDWLALQVALAPCLIGYGAVAERLLKDPNTLRDGNKYWVWIEATASDSYMDAVKVGRELLEKHAVKLSPSRVDELVKIFIHATRMEAGFWDMAQDVT